MYEYVVDGAHGQHRNSLLLTQQRRDRAHSSPQQPRPFPHRPSRHHQVAPLTVLQIPQEREQEEQTGEYIGPPDDPRHGFRVDRMWCEK